MTWCCIMPTELLQFIGKHCVRTSKKITNKYRAISNNLAHAPDCNEVLCPLDVTILKNDGKVSHTRARLKHCKDRQKVNLTFVYPTNNFLKKFSCPDLEFSTAHMLLLSCDLRERVREDAQQTITQWYTWLYFSKHMRMTSLCNLRNKRADL